MRWAAVHPGGVACDTPRGTSIDRHRTFGAAGV
jgi:hypothetical protein